MNKGICYMDISLTALSFGLSAMLAFNATGTEPNVMNWDYLSMQLIQESDDRVSTLGVMTTENEVVVNSARQEKLMNEAREVFGEMRDATKEEQRGVQEYIKSISSPTGRNFFE